MICAPWIDEVTCDTGTLDPDVVLSYIEAASEVMWMLGGRRHGTCTDIVRPCRSDFIPVDGWHEWGQGWFPIRYAGEWFNVCNHSTGCSCAFLSEIKVPLSNVSSVTNVIVAGTVMDPADWRVDNGNMLVRLDGSLWPACQDVAAPIDDEDSWGVEFTWGADPGRLGELAVEELACELIKAKLGLACRLPQRVTTITRQGISMTLLDPQEFLRDGKTGLYLPDLWLQAVNPEKLAQPSAVYSPDSFVRRPRFTGEAWPP